MTISGALSNALSGLTAASRSAEVVAANIANATTEGYAARTLVLSSHSIGGVAIQGVQRSIEPSLLADRRLADAEQGYQTEITTTLKRMEELVGGPLEVGSLSVQTNAFEAALIEAASRPESTERLDRAVESADLLAKKIRDISTGIQSIRTAADRRIADQVSQLNNDLEQARLMNKQIVSFTAQGLETAPLLDARQGIIDRIAAVVPVTEVPRDKGAVALFTPGGAILLDISAAKIGFTSSNLVTPHMTQSGGTLSGLTINSIPVSTDPKDGPLRGGRLDAAFEVRDKLTVTMQQQLDATARDLIERLAVPNLDNSLSLGQPGLFTDAGGALDSALETGLAGRIAINPAVSSTQGGQSWRLRDGIGTLQPGPSGDASLLHRLTDALASRRAPAMGGSNQDAFTFPELATKVLSGISITRQFAEERQIYANTRASALKQAELERGVDTDDQLQRLLKIEQAYAANARVIQTVGEMMDSLLRI